MSPGLKACTNAEREFESQAKEINAALVQAAEMTDFYRERLAVLRADKRRIIGLEDFLRIKPTSYDNLREHPLAFLAVSAQKVTTVGTTSRKPSKLVLASDVFAADAHRVTPEEKLGAIEGDHVTLLPYSTNIAPAVIPLRWKARGITCTVVATDALRFQPNAVFELLLRTRTSVIRSTPNVMVNATKLAAANGFAPSSLDLKFVTLTGSPITANIRTFLQDHWSTRLHGIWGANELGEIGTECAEHLGTYHIDEKGFFVEIVDELGDPASPGEIGEVLVTRLRPTTLALVRYQLRNLVRSRSEGCACPLSGKRLEVLGRPEDVRHVGRSEVAIYPFQIRNTLSRFPALTGAFELSICRAGNVDVLRFCLNLLDAPTNELQFRRKIQDQLTADLGLQDSISHAEIRLEVSLRSVDVLDDPWGTELKLVDSVIDNRSS